MLLQVLLSFGAVDALIPLIVIIVLIAAAAGISRGYDIFAIFGIGVLAGIGSKAGGKGSLAGKSVYKGRTGSTTSKAFARSPLGQKITKTAAAGGKKIGETVRAKTPQIGATDKFKNDAGGISTASKIMKTVAGSQVVKMVSSGGGKMVRMAAGSRVARKTGMVKGAQIVKKVATKVAANTKVRAVGGGAKKLAKAVEVGALYTGAGVLATMPMMQGAGLRAWRSLDAQRLSKSYSKTETEFQKAATPEQKQTLQDRKELLAHRLDELSNKYDFVIASKDAPSIARDAFNYEHAHHLAQHGAVRMLSSGSSAEFNKSLAAAGRRIKGNRALAKGGRALSAVGGKVAPVGSDRRKAARAVGRGLSAYGRTVAGAVANDMTGRFVGEKGIQRALTKAENEKFEKRIAGLAKKVIFYDALAGLEKSKLSPEEKNKRISQLYKEYRMNTSKLEGASEKGKRVEGYNPKSKFSQVNIQKQIVKLTTRGLYRYQPMPEPESEKTTNVLTTGPTRGERAVSYVANSRINRWAKRRAEGQGEKYNAGTGVVGVGRRFWMKTDSEARAENALKEARKGEAQRKKEKEKSKKNKKP